MAIKIKLKGQDSIASSKVNESVNTSSSQSLLGKFKLQKDVGTIESPLETPIELPVNTQSEAFQHPQVQKVNDAIYSRFMQLQKDLTFQNPNISGNLRLIHRALLDDPEQVTLLTNDQRTLFFAGLMKQTGVELSITNAKSKSGSKKEYKQMTVDDLL